MRRWTFGQKITAGFAVTLALTLLMGGVTIATLRNVVESKDRLVTQYAENLISAQRLDSLYGKQSAQNRAYLLTGDQAYLVTAQEFRKDFAETARAIEANLTNPDARRQVERIQAAEATYQAGAKSLLQTRAAGSSSETIMRRFEAELAPHAEALSREIETFKRLERDLLDKAKAASTQDAEQGSFLVLVIAALALGLATTTAVVLTRSLSRQIGSSIQHLQSSSTELHAAANQQATGSGEQAAAMTEVSTTMKELLSTSRQIAESAQQVARIAEETAMSARSGDRTVLRAQEAVSIIKRQVDQIVLHMLDLGRKSQQVGGILEIIKELAEQTNILAINATIEAAGAGESGKRFAAVADEIRKLADRVSGSTGDIRMLIDEIRSAANTTVMTTEDGSKAVEMGTQQFGELAAAFTQIASLVGTTAEAAREIELSTKQQATAVEQVNIAISDVAQAAKETEASSRQTLQTSSQLAGVSRELAQIVRASR
jgi:methyl-accepting chemotaxis protein